MQLVAQGHGNGLDLVIGEEFGVRSIAARNVISRHIFITLLFKEIGNGDDFHVVETRNRVTR